MGKNTGERGRGKGKREGVAAGAATSFVWGFYTGGLGKRRISDLGFRISGRCAAEAARAYMGDVDRRGINGGGKNQKTLRGSVF